MTEGKKAIEELVAGLREEGSKGDHSGSAVMLIGDDALRTLRADLAEAVEALRPFYGFGNVLETANEKGGHACVQLYGGLPPEENGKIPSSPDFGDELDLSSISPDGCLFGIVGSWDKVPASFMTPVLQAKHFFRAAAIVAKHGGKKG